jgi:hypothetical protein
VCVGDDMTTSIAPLGSPLKADVASLFGVRVTRVGEVLYGVKYAGKAGLEWRREVSGIQDLDDKIAAFIAMISPTGLVIHPVSPARECLNTSHPHPCWVLPSHCPCFGYFCTCRPLPSPHRFVCKHCTTVDARRQG